MSKTDLAKISLLVTVGLLLMQGARWSAQSESKAEAAHAIASDNIGNIDDLERTVITLLETVKYQARAAKQHYDYTVTSEASKMNMMKCIERLTVLMETHDRRLTTLEIRKE